MLNATTRWEYAGSCSALMVFAAMFGAFGHACTPGFSVAQAIYWIRLWLLFDALYILMGIAVLAVLVFAIMKIPRIRSMPSQTLKRYAIVIVPACVLVIALLVPLHGRCVYL